MNAITRPAIWDDTHMAINQSEAVFQVGMQQCARMVVDGIEWRSWIPDDRAEADAINACAAKIMNATTQ